MYEKELFNAIIKSDTKEVELVLSRGANIDVGFDPSENPIPMLAWPPLSLAVERDDYAMVKLLIEKGANVNIRNFMGQTPFHGATKIEIVRLLVENGADIHALNIYGKSRLHYSMNSDVAKFLVPLYSDLNKINNDGLTPLDVAIEVGDKDVIDILKNAGASGYKY